MEREDEISIIAYRIWEEEGRCHGHDCEQWLKAEVVWEEKQKEKAASMAPKTAAKHATEQGRKGRSTGKRQV